MMSEMSAEIEKMMNGQRSPSGPTKNPPITGPVTNPARATPPIAPSRSEIPFSSSEAIRARAGGRNNPLPAPATKRATMNTINDEPAAKRAFPSSAKIVAMISSRLA